MSEQAMERPTGLAETALELTQRPNSIFRRALFGGYKTQDVDHYVERAADVLESLIEENKRARVALDDQKRPYYRAQRALGLARVGRPAEAVTEAEHLAGSPNLDTNTLYALAGAFARAAAAAKDDAPAAERHAARAVGLLRQAAAKGYKDVAFLKKDPDLDALRRRSDFTQLITELEAKARITDGIL